MRRLALAMPEAEEKAHFAQPDFRVRGKIFAGLSADEKRGTLKLTPEIQSTVVAPGSSAFTPCSGAWGRSGWTFVDLASVDVKMLGDLIEEAWRLVAPKSLARARDGGADATSAKAGSRKKKRAATSKRPR
jgi:hypothetical protein